MHYATLWEAIADRIPDRPALQHGARQVSWGDFERRSAQLAAALGERGLGRDDGVAAYLYNCPEYFEIFFAVLKIRAVPSNVNYRYQSDELLALMQNSGARALFFDASLREPVASVAARVPGVLLVEVGAGDDGAPVPGALSYEELLAGAQAAPRIERDDGHAFLSYTGGTTGLPKGVLFRIGQSAGNSLWFRDLFLGVHHHARARGVRGPPERRGVVVVGHPCIAADAQHGIYLCFLADADLRRRGHHAGAQVLRRGRALGRG